MDSASERTNPRGFSGLRQPSFRFRVDSGRFGKQFVQDHAVRVGH